MSQLGCPEEYEAVIVNSRTQATLAHLPWNSIAWQRLRNGISQASVTVAQGDGGIECCAVFGGLFPWEQMLRIERNGEIVWDGPITGWSRPAITNRGLRDFTVRAHDRFVITQKRLVALSRVLNEQAPQIAYHLLSDAHVGNPDYDPYDLTIPPPSQIKYSTSAESPLNPDGSQVTYEREYRVERLETVSTAFNEIVEAGELFYTCKGDEVFMDEASLRNALGPRNTRPILNEHTVLDIPGIGVDGLKMATVAYAGGLSQGEHGFAVVRFDDFWRGTYLDSTLEIATDAGKSLVGPDIYKAARIAAGRAVTPNLTIEQTPLSPVFGGPLMTANFANLLPGVWFDVDFEDTCAFDISMVDIGWENRYGYNDEDGAPVDVYQLTPLISDRIQSCRLDQLDVTVSMSGKEIKEDVRASCIPQVEWDGLLPDGYPEYLWLLQVL